MELEQALDYYRNCGYKYVDVPTFVPGKIINATCPPWGDFRPEAGLFHVASAEQSFLYMLYRGDSLKGKYQTITACHRPSDKNSGPEYKEWFIKLELYSSNPNDYLLIIEDAITVYAKHLDIKEEKIDIVKTDLGLDLFFNGIEIGSYGKREALGFKWSYGTGFVPFRLNYVKELGT